MVETKMTKVLRKDLVNGVSQYVKDGYLDIDEIKVSHEEILFCCGGVPLITGAFGTWFDHEDGATLTMKWDSPAIKLRLSLENA